jgi:hypothetical protein
MVEMESMREEWLNFQGARKLEGGEKHERREHRRVY